MHGPTCIFRPNLTPFSLQDTRQRLAISQSLFALACRNGVGAIAASGPSVAAVCTQFLACFETVVSAVEDDGG